MTNWLCVVKKDKGVKLTSNIWACNVMIRTTAGRVSLLQEEERASVWAMLILRCCYDNHMEMYNQERG